MEYAAHIRSSDGKVQTVQEHIENVSKIVSEYSSEALNAPNLGTIIGILHDCGKLTPRFNDYIRGKNNCKRGDIDHSFCGAKYIGEYADAKEQMASDFIGRVILSHHGLNDWLNDEGKSNFERRITKEEDYKIAKEELENFISKIEFKNLYLDAVKEYEKICNSIKDLVYEYKAFKISKGDKNPKGQNKQYAFYLGLFERIMESMLIDGDRRDTADFMSNTEYKGNNNRNIWNDMQQRLDNKLSQFDLLTDPISLQRRSISNRCFEFANNKAGICQLIVPTGGGKTLSSLRFAIEYCKKHNLNRIIYTAPFMSILEQNGDVIGSIAGEENYLEHHSNIVFEDDEQQELEKYELYSENWDKPVIATTMVQLLNSLFDGRTTSVRRMHRLAKSVIIIDEIQSLPLKCVNMFNLAMNFLSKICGSVVVLCSATQPDFSLSMEKFYPMFLDKNSSITGDSSEDFRLFKRTEIISAIKTGGYSYEEAAEFCLKKFKTKGNLLVIVNTKSAALNLYRLIKESEPDAEVRHLSTNMCPKHRKKVLDEIRDLLPKKSVICITTQLIEAGVDISFSCVVRALAGMDNAAQAAGRCNRDGKIPEVCPVYLINISDEKLGNLQEIKNAGDISIQMINNENYKDYLSVETMRDYFKKLYSENLDNLSYPVDTIDQNLLNILSLNQNKFDLCKNNRYKYSSQGFETAGKLFQVIDSNTTQVIVPFDDKANEIIEKLNSDLTPEETKKYIRQAQRYTVGVYDNMKRNLGEAIYMLKSGVMVLDKRYYDNEVGITQEAGTREILMC